MLVNARREFTMHSALVTVPVLVIALALTFAQLRPALSLPLYAALYLAFTLAYRGEFRRELRAHVAKGIEQLQNEHGLGDARIDYAWTSDHELEAVLECRVERKFYLARVTAPAPHALRFLAPMLECTPKVSAELERIDERVALARRANPTLA